MSVSKENILLVSFLSNLQKGDLNSFKILFQVYYHKVKNYILKFSVGDEIAKDLTQEVFVKIWVNREKILLMPDKFEHYIFTISKNMVYNHFRSRKVVNEFQLKFSQDIIQECGLENIMDAKRSLKNIQLILEKMPEKRREIFIMSRFQNLSNDEIAEKLGISKHTVENHISTSLKQIKSELLSISVLMTFFIS